MVIERESGSLEVWKVRDLDYNPPFQASQLLEERRQLKDEKGYSEIHQALTNSNSKLQKL